MGLIRRLQHITRAKIEAFLQSVENPALILPRLVAELEDSVRVALAAEAKALTAVRATQRKLDEIAGRIERLQRGAELALRQQDAATARDALAAQMEAERTRDRLRLELQRAESAHQEAHHTRLQLTSDLDSLRERSATLIVRARVAQGQPGGAGAGAGAATGSLLDQVSRLEARVNEDEARIALQRTAGQGATAPLEVRLSKLEQQAEVEKRLADLKRRPSSGKQATP